MARPGAEGIALIQPTGARVRVPMLVALMLLSCGGSISELDPAEGSPATDDPNELSVAPSASDDPRCDTILGQVNAPYPAHWLPSLAERERYSDQVGEFRAFHGADADIYTLDANAGTTTPTIMRRRAGDSSGIRLADGPLDENTMGDATAGFLTRWAGLINPYEVELTLEAPHFQGEYVERNLTQSFCGLALRGDQGYGGTVNLVAYRSNSTLLWVQASLVPLVPLPAPVLGASDLAPALVGEELASNCSRQRVTEAACQTTDPTLVVFVRPAADGIEYRLAYELALHAGSCSSDAPTWTVIVDAIDSSILAAGNDEACPPY